MNHPLQSLYSGQWFKLICGASFQHLPSIRYLAIAYSLAGADCLDVAADPAVVRAVQHALTEAQRAYPQLSVEFWAERERLSSPDQAQVAPAAGMTRPWIMVSLNDGEDPHFRKATFDPTRCPSDCPRPCEAICPAEAITFAADAPQVGVVDARCYGCGRCVRACPIQQITTRSHQVTPAVITELIELGIDAIEIHTQVGHLTGFQRLWQVIAPHLNELKLIAISCPSDDGVVAYLRSLYDQIAPLPIPLIWQADGRPMSGDLGDSTTTATIQYGQMLCQADLPGFIQLAGGTNQTTVPKLRSQGLLVPEAIERPIAGVAYGSYARTHLAAVVEQLDQLDQVKQLEPLEQVDQAARVPNQRVALLAQAVAQARSLVAPLKSGADLPVFAAPTLSNLQEAGRMSLRSEKSRSTAFVPSVNGAVGDRASIRDG